MKGVVIKMSGEVAYVVKEDGQVHSFANQASDANMDDAREWRAWTPSEDKVLMNNVLTLMNDGISWKRISNEFTRRTPAAIRNRFTRMFIRNNRIYDCKIDGEYMEKFGQLIQPVSGDDQPGNDENDFSGEDNEILDKLVTRMSSFIPD